MAMAGDSYPVGRKFHLAKVARAMYKSSAALEIGAMACHLVTTVAVTEDSTHYTRAVGFHNTSLQDAIGATSYKIMALAREKAVKAGWLVYKPGRKGVIGKYWTMIPEHIQNNTSGAFDELAEVVDGESDTDSDDAERDEKGKCNGQEKGNEKVNAKDTKRETQTASIGNELVNETGENRERIGKPFIPIPIPIPIPPQAAAAEQVATSNPPPEDPRMTEEREFVRDWNALAVGHHVRGNRGVALTDARRIHFRARLADPLWDWRAALAKFPLPFCEGNEWKPDVDFFLKPDSVTKILEGRYDWRRQESRTAAARDAQPKHLTDAEIEKRNQDALNRLDPIERQAFLDRKATRLKAARPENSTGSAADAANRHDGIDGRTPAAQSGGGEIHAGSHPA